MRARGCPVYLTGLRFCSRIFMLRASVESEGTVASDWTIGTGCSIRSDAPSHCRAIGAAVREIPAKTSISKNALEALGASAMMGASAVALVA
jgi:hypothetical protein